MNTIIKHLDDYLTRTGRSSIDPVEANALLAKAGILRDSIDRPGKPLRDLLRKGQLPHAFQSGGKGSSWTIPHSSSRRGSSTNYPTPSQPIKKIVDAENQSKTSGTIDPVELKKQLEKARHKYKPDKIKYLLIAEAPPDSVERFFYYENVHQHDYLFLGVAQALYPNLKEKYLASRRPSDIKKSILEKLKSEEFYLLDLSELPLTLLNQSLESQLPNLVKKIKEIVDKQRTKIILIKATVYDTVFKRLLQEGFENVIDVRIPFPGQGGQIRFQNDFKKALELAGYF